MSDAREKMLEVMARAICSSWAGGSDEKAWGGLTERSRANARLDATAALSALEAAGVRLVPEFSTFEMESAVKDEHIPHRDIYGHLPLDRRREGASDIYRAMLAASPYAPQKDESND